MLISVSVNPRQISRILNNFDPNAAETKEGWQENKQRFLQESNMLFSLMFSGQCGKQKLYLHGGEINESY